MQKKNRNPEASQSSDWQDGLKKEEKKQLFKKIAIWTGIVAVCIAGIAALVMFANKSTTGTNEVIETTNFPAVTDKDIIVGDKTAKITITEYSDMQCPACASYNPVVNRVLEEYKGKVRVAFRFFPLRGIHQNAVISGQAAYAANKLGKFSKMKDLLYEKQPEWEKMNDPKETFESYAESLEMDVVKFREIMNSDEAKDAVIAGETEALKLGLNSTPSFFIGNKRFTPQGYDSFKTLIDEELKNSGVKPTSKPLQ